MRRHSMSTVGPVPKLPTKVAAYVGGHRYKPKGVPAREHAAYWELACLFRDGEIYAFSWEPKTGTWETWDTAADWDATEREGVIKRPDLAAAGHGPKPWAPVAAAKPTRLTKAQLVSGLRALDLPAEALALLERA